MSEGQHHHRAGALKQKNKSFKTGRHSSKGEIKKKNAGKVSEAPRASIKHQTVVNKRDRRNTNKQLQKNKRELLLQKNRGTFVAPKIVGIIGLTPRVDTQAVLKQLLETSETTFDSLDGPLTVCVLQSKQRFTFCASPRDKFIALDVAKVADVLLFVYEASDEEIDSYGHEIISMIKGQGIPSVIGIIQGLDKIPQKYGAELKKTIAKDYEFHFGEDVKVIPVINEQDVGQVFRFASSMKVKEIHWREIRPYFLIDNHSFIDSEEDGKGTVAVSGYLKGASLSANQLVYITDCGYFSISKIEGPKDPCPLKKEYRGGMSIEEADLIELENVDPEQKEKFVFNPPPVLDEDQWQNEQIEEPVELDLTIKTKKRVPKGTSEYQAAWIWESDEEQGEDEEGEEEGEEGEEKMKNEGDTNQEEEEEEEEEEELDDDQWDNVNEIPENIKIKQMEEDLEFPDEVDTPNDVPARVKFAGYRGMKSFRNSEWDAKENLPKDYTKIFQFQSFMRAQQRVMKDFDGQGVLAGRYITVHLVEFPKDTYDSQFNAAQKKPMTLSGVFKYENQISVLNFSIQKHSSAANIPVLSTEELVFHCGFRKFVGYPLFSENATNRQQKYKYEKFLQDGRACVATVYGPITFLPSNVLVFKGEEQLIAVGALQSVNPDRVVLEKVILTGDPTKIHKKSAVIKDMFFNPEDVKWFKPIELWTKKGRTGHILGSLGTHGLMKVHFDGGIHNDDVVCMTLYKRVFPVLPSKNDPYNTLIVNRSSDSSEVDMMGEGKKTDGGEQLE